MQASWGGQGRRRWLSAAAAMLCYAAEQVLSSVYTGTVAWQLGCACTERFEPSTEYWYRAGEAARPPFLSMSRIVQGKERKAVRQEGGSHRYTTHIKY